ncbi:MAG TPA: MFS transporter [Candidatus Limnocylindria bacterium]|nr:MFS transporter [Candidatus Limnocylindria bacterium]
MLRILRQPNFARLWFGGLISITGDWMLITGLPIEIYRLTGSTFALGGMAIAFMIPSITLGSIAGVFVDRWDRRRLMVAIDALMVITILPLMAIESLGVWIAYVVLFAASCLDQLFSPAEEALLPNLLENEDDDLVTANALNGLNNHLARLIGPALGGIIVALGGIVAVTLIDAVSFLVAALLIWSIRSHRTKAVRHTSIEHEAATAWIRLLGEWREGLREIWRRPVLRALLFFSVITFAGEGLTLTLFVPWTIDALHSDSAGYGALLSTQAIGGFAGAFVIGRLGSRVDPLRLLIWSALLFGVIDLGLFTYPAIFPHIEPALVIMVVVGVPGAGLMAARSTLRQSLTSDSHRGRVIGAMAALGSLGSLVGAVAAGFLGEFLPVVLLLVVQGSGYVIGSLVVSAMTRGQRLPKGELVAEG